MTAGYVVFFRAKSGDYWQRLPGRFTTAEEASAEASRMRRDGYHCLTAYRPVGPILGGGGSNG